MRGLVCLLLLWTAHAGAAPSPWVEAMLAARAAGSPAAVRRAWPVQTDWLMQDAGDRWTTWFDATQGPEVTATLLARLGLSAAAGQDEAERLARYEAACEQRRARFLAPLRARMAQIVFAKHGPLGGSHYAYTEAQSDAQAERNFVPGAALCTLDLASGAVKVLLETKTGVIRDPDVSYDGKRILFAYKKSDREDDYHLHELDAATGQTRQLTFGLGVADYEGAYLPGGDIVFNSTRCGQIVDCWWTEVSNLYRCDRDGSRIRRVSYDQVHTNSPSVLPDGRVVYTRWDYNDRGQIFPQGLFQMAADGTNQTAFYGNNSWFPTTIIHARGIPGSGRLMAIATGHHSYQPGKLIAIDPAKGREENSGITLLAPERPTPAERIDAYGQQGELFAYPYPLSETELLVTYHPRGWDPKVHRGREPGFGIYFMTTDGRRELLVSDPDVSCGQSVPLAPRPEPRVVTRRDEGARDGTYYVQDVHRGPGLVGIPRGRVKKLRVVAIEYRPAGVGSNGNHGPAGGALSSTPPSLSNGAWDVKRILGDATVYPDGSAFFRVPARTPVYFQALDERNQMVQTMRTWSTLQPGENASCTGCHESKNDAPPNTGRTQALQAGIQELDPFWGPARGFSFAAEVQPLLDAKCVSCHNDPKLAPPRVNRATAQTPPCDLVAPEAEWRYTTTAPPQGWEQPGFDDTAWATGRAGFGRQGTPGGRIGTVWDQPAIWLRRTITLPAPLGLVRPVWRLWHDEDVKVFVNGQEVLALTGFNQAFEVLPLSAAAQAAFRPGANTVAVWCANPVGGGQAIDLALAETGSPGDPRPTATRAFSLRGEPVSDPRAKRRWSEAYLALTQATQDANTGEWRGFSGDPVNWTSVQSAPTMLPPLSGGAARSRLLTMLDEGHAGVKLSAAERDKLAAWIDLLVPFCGDYAEAADWTPAEHAKYTHYLAKRERYAALDGQATVVEAPLTLSLADAAGQVVATTQGTARRDQPLSLTVNRPFAAGDTLRLAGAARDVAVRVGADWPEALLHLPSGALDYKLPVGPEARAYAPGAHAAERPTITVRLAAAEELITYRNLARNPLDQRGETASAYPHATTNSECRGEPVFAARCAVDGFGDNRGHGAWPHQSWGPDQRRDLWLKVDFGRPVEVNRLVLSIRADFPHDAWWRSATLEFSDGSRQPITLTNDPGRQTFDFAPRRVSWARLCDLQQPEPLGWAAISEMEVWGADVVGR